jgi:hypothetical protein
MNNREKHGYLDLSQGRRHRVMPSARHRLPWTHSRILCSSRGWRRGWVEICPADLSGGKGRGGGAPELGIARSALTPHATRSGNKLGLACYDVHPPSDIARVGPVIVCWAGALFWCVVKLAQVSTVLVIFLTSV